MILEEVENLNFFALEQSGDCALTLASQNGHDDIVRLLVDKGANLNMQDKVSC